MKAYSIVEQWMVKHAGLLGAVIVLAILTVIAVTIQTMWGSPVRSGWLAYGVVATAVVGAYLLGWMASELS